MMGENQNTSVVFFINHIAVLRILIEFICDEPKDASALVHKNDLNEEKTTNKYLIMGLQMVETSYWKPPAWRNVP